MSSEQSVAALADRFGIPEDGVRELIDAAMAQLDTQVSDFLREPASFPEDDVRDLRGLIVANALDMALPEGVDRDQGRRLLDAVVRPRLREIEESDEFDPQEAVRRVVDRTFPIEVREETRKERRFRRMLRRADRAVEDLGLGPGELPDRDERE